MAKVDSKEQFRNLTASASETDEPLGYMTYYSVSAGRVTPVELERIFDYAGIDKDYMPEPIEINDAFKKAARRSEVRDTTVYPQGLSGPSMNANILVRTVKTNDSRPVKQIVREILDKHGETLDYQPVAKVELEKGNVIWNSLGTLCAEELDVIDSIRDKFTEERDSYDSQAIRRIIVNIIDDCAPVMMRNGGGIYFIPKEFRDTVKALETFAQEIRTLNPDVASRTQVMAIDLVDRADYRESVEENIKVQIEKEGEVLIRELVHQVAKGKEISERKQETYMLRFRDIKKKVETLQKNLDSTLAESEVTLDMIQNRVRKLITESLAIED